MTGETNLRLFFFPCHMLKEPGTRLHSGRKKQHFCDKQVGSGEGVGGGGGKCASATFSFPN